MANRFWVGGTGSLDGTTTQWSATSGGEGGASFPTASDDVFFDGNSGGGTVTMATTLLCRSVDFTGFGGTFTGTYLMWLYGSMTLTSGMTFTQSGGVVFGASTTGNIVNTAGKVIPGQVQFTGTGSYSLEDDLIVSNTISQDKGTLDMNDFNIQCTRFTSNSGIARTLYMRSGTLDITGTSYTWRATASNFTFYPGTGRILISNTSTSTKSFYGGGLSYNKVEISGQRVYLYDNNSYAELKIGYAGGSYGTYFAAGSTHSVTNLIAQGASGSLVRIRSVTAGTPFTFSCSSGTIACDYINLSDSTATGGASWYAGSHSTDSGGNTGWSFTDPPAGITDISVSDTGSGSEVNALTNMFSVSESSSSNDSLNFLAQLPVLDSASATDSPSMINTPIVSESTEASEGLNFLASTPVSDVATGDDQSGLLAMFALAEAGYSADQASILGMLVLLDSATVVELPNQSEPVSYIGMSDTGAGDENMSASALFQPSVTDSGSGLEMGNPDMIDSFGENNSEGLVRLDVSTSACGQTFVGNGNFVDFCEFYLSEDTGLLGGVTGQIYAKLYAMTGTYGMNGLPTGSPLATSSPVDAFTIAEEPRMVKFLFGQNDRYFAQDGSYYCIVLEYQTTDENNSILVYGHFHPAMPGEHPGNGIIGTGSGPSWNTLQGMLVSFYVGVDPGVSILHKIMSFIEDSTAVDTSSVLYGANVIDAGNGEDTLGIFTQLSITDTSNSDEMLQLLNTFSISDQVAASDIISLFNHLTTLDTASGEDSSFLQNIFTVQDNAVGSDVSELLVILSAIADSGSGNEMLQLLNAFSVSDQVSASDIISLLRHLTTLDSASGDDSTSLQNIFTVQDSAVGNDVIELLAILNSIVDNASGNEMFNITVFVTQDDQALAVDGVSRYIFKIYMRKTSPYGTNALPYSKKINPYSTKQ